MLRRKLKILTKTLLYFALVVAGVGLIFSLIFPVMILTEMGAPTNEWLWALHVGLLIVWSIVFWSGEAFRRRGIRHNFWGLKAPGRPNWLKASVALLLGYALLNFTLFAIGALVDWFPFGEGAPVLIHAFTALWIMFYTLGLDRLYLALKANHLLSPLYCPQGHRVSRSHTVCLYCGAKIDKETRAA